MVYTPSQKIVFYLLAIFLITSVATVGYSLIIDWKNSTFWYATLMIGCFFVLFSNVSNLIIDKIVLRVSRPLILAELDYSKEIPSDKKTAIVYPILNIYYHKDKNGRVLSKERFEFYKQKAFENIDFSISNFEKSLVENLDPKGNVIGIYLSQTFQNDLLAYELKKFNEAKKRIEARYFKEYKINLKDKIAYHFHRTKNWQKKFGAYQDLILYLKGQKEPVTQYQKTGRENYNMINREFFAKLRTNANEPIIEDIIGDVKSLNINNPEKDVKFLIMADNDCVWPKGTVKKIVQKMANPANSQYGIFQPNIKTSNVNETPFTRLSAITQEIMAFSNESKWITFENFIFHGKGGIILDKYKKEIIDKERIKLNTLSHDIVESAFLPTAYISDISIFEDTPSNYFVETERYFSRWCTGTLQSVREVFHKDVKPKQKLLTLFPIKSYLSEPIFLFWILCGWITLLFYSLKNVGYNFPLLISVSNPALAISLWVFTIYGVAGVKYIGADRKKVNEEIFKAPLISMQSMFRGTKGVIEAMYIILISKKFRWEPMAVTEARLGKISLFQSYLLLWPSFITAIVISIFIVRSFSLTHFPFWWWVILIFPLLISWLFGPLYAYLSSKPYKNSEK